MSEAQAMPWTRVMRTKRDRSLTALPRGPLDYLLSAHRAGRHLILLFDYDGALVPIVEHPQLARLAPRTRLLLKQLARQPRVSVGVLSGRKLDDLQEMVALPGLYYAGTNGLELELRGVRVTSVEA